MASFYQRLTERTPALRHKRFVYLWLGQLISIAGSQMQVWAMFWHISKINPNPIAVSGVGVARFVPILIFSLIGGVSADRFNRRMMLFITQSAMVLVAGMLALLTFAHQIQLWHIYLLTALQAVAMAFDGPARQSLLPNLIEDRRHLPSAFSLQSIAANTGAIVGPALSGLVIAHMGQGYTYLFNAISFVAVLVALVLMGPVAQGVVARATTERKRLFDFASMKEGIQFTLRQPIILSSMVLDFWATFFSSANTLLPFVSQQILHVGAIQYGWLSAAQSIGAVTTGLIMAQHHDLKKQGNLLLQAVVAFGVGTIVFGLSRNFWLTMGALAVVGASDTVSTILRNTIRQLQTPDYIRGRMVSINQIFFMGGPQLGEIEAGAVAQGFGLEAAIVTGGLGCILAVGLVAAKWPQLREYNGDEPVVA